MTSREYRKELEITAATLLQMAREGDGEFTIERVFVRFTHVDGRSWRMRFETPAEARGWLDRSTR